LHPAFVTFKKKPVLLPVDFNTFNHLIKTPIYWGNNLPGYLNASVNRLGLTFLNINAGPLVISRIFLD
jgi:hypothetical protein